MTEKPLWPYQSVVVPEFVSPRKNPRGLARAVAPQAALSVGPRLVAAGESCGAYTPTVCQGAAQGSIPPARDFLDFEDRHQRPLASPLRRSPGNSPIFETQGIRARGYPKGASFGKSLDDQDSYTLGARQAGVADSVSETAESRTDRGLKPLTQRVLSYLKRVESRGLILSSGLSLRTPRGRSPESPDRRTPTASSADYLLTILDFLRDISARSSPHTQD